MQDAIVQLLLALLFAKVRNFIPFDFRTVCVERLIVGRQPLVAARRRQMLLLLAPHIEIHLPDIVARCPCLRIRRHDGVILRRCGSRETRGRKPNYDCPDHSHRVKDSQNPNPATGAKRLLPYEGDVTDFLPSDLS